MTNIVLSLNIVIYKVEGLRRNSLQVCSQTNWDLELLTIFSHTAGGFVLGEKKNFSQNLLEMAILVPTETILMICVQNFGTYSYCSKILGMLHAHIGKVKYMQRIEICGVCMVLVCGVVLMGTIV